MKYPKDRDGAPVSVQGCVHSRMEALQLLSPQFAAEIHK